MANKESGIDDNVGLFNESAPAATNVTLPADRAKIQVLRSSTKDAKQIAGDLLFGEFAIGKSGGNYDLWIGGDSADAQKIVLSEEFDSKIEQLKADIGDDLGQVFHGSIKYDAGSKKVIIGEGTTDENGDPVNEVLSVDIEKDTTIKKDLTVNEDLTVEGTSSLKGATTIGTDAVAADLTVKGNVSVNSDITAGGKLTSDSVTTGDITSSGNLTLSGGDIGVTGKIDASGAVSAASVSTTGNVTAGGDVSSVNVSASSDVTAGGKVAATGDVTAGGKVAATGDVTAGGNIIATGDVSSANVNTGKVTATGDISTSTNISAGGNITATGSVTAASGQINGTLKVGKLEIDGDVTVIEQNTVATSDNFLELNLGSDANGVNRDLAGATTAGIVLHGTDNKDLVLHYQPDSTAAGQDELNFKFGAFNEADNSTAGDSVLSLKRNQSINISGTPTAADQNVMVFDGHISADSFGGSVDGGIF